MTIEEYQKLSRETAVYPGAGKNFIYPTLGLAGETGETVEIIKKVMRDSNGQISAEAKTALINELGDILWYMAQLATETGLSLDNIAQTNIEKLRSRKERGVLHGQGNDR